MLAGFAVLDATTLKTSRLQVVTLYEVTTITENGFKEILYCETTHDELSKIEQARQNGNTAVSKEIKAIKVSHNEYYVLAAEEPIKTYQTYLKP